MSPNYRSSFGDFRTDYLLWDTFNPPFDSLDVHTAFATAVNRASNADKVFGINRAIPAHSLLMTGFPSSDTEAGPLSNLHLPGCTGSPGPSRLP